MSIKTVLSPIYDEKSPIDREFMTWDSTKRDMLFNSFANWKIWPGEDSQTAIRYPPSEGILGNPRIQYVGTRLDNGRPQSMISASFVPFFHELH